LRIQILILAWLLVSLAGAQQPGTTPAHSPCVVTLGKLIAETEGWNKTTSLVRRQHNPGALRLRSGPYRTYADDATGWESLFLNIERLRRGGLAWRQVIRIWSEVPDRYERAIAPRFFKSCSD
jgi:hypothetical protein